MSFVMNKQQAQDEIDALNAAITKHQELNSYRERLETLEATLVQAMNRAEFIEEANVKLREEKQLIQNKGAFYDLILKTVNEHEVLQPIWDELFTLMKMMDPDIEYKFAAINQGNIL